MSDAMYEQAKEDFNEALAELFAENFCRGSDTLGPAGWRIVGSTLQLIGAALAEAGRKADAKHGDGYDGPVVSLDELRGRDKPTAA
jgi:hypothetical protein